jgi:hypothetical protein
MYNDHHIMKSRLTLRSQRLYWVLSVTLCLCIHSLNAQTEITLKDSFIQKYKLRATIDANYIIDKAHPKPNPPANDGDMHVAGRSDDIGLATVAEIMNAKFETSAVNYVHQHEGENTPVKLSGAWRLWCEHAGKSEQIQGETLEPFQTTNPDHVFEVHPITKLDDLLTTDSFKPIKGFKTKEANDAFNKYESAECHIRHDTSNHTTTLRTKAVGYNYVEFILELLEKPLIIEDGQMVMATVCDLQGEVIANSRRMIFVKDTPPEKKLMSLKAGDRIHVVGIPRIDLSLVWWRVEQAKPAALDWNLPYEIIVVGVYSR